MNLFVLNNFGICNTSDYEILELNATRKKIHTITFKLPPQRLIKFEFVIVLRLLRFDSLKLNFYCFKSS